MTTLLIISGLVLGAAPPAPVSTYTFADPCKPYVTMAAVPDTYGCYSFTASIGALPTSSSYFSWQFGDGTSATGTSVAHCYTPVTSPSILTGTLTYNTPALCGPNSTSTTFTVGLNPPPSASCVTAGPGIIKSALSVTVPSGFYYPEIIRHVDFGDGDGFSPIHTHTYTKCGSYIVTLKTWDMNAPDPVCYGYTAIVFDCNGTPTGTRDIQRMMPRLFPHPAGERLTITSEKSISALSVIDVQGRELPLSFDEEAQGKVAGTSAFPPGAYVVKIVYFDKTVDFVRFLKE